MVVSDSRGGRRVLGGVGAKFGRRHTGPEDLIGRELAVLDGEAA